MAETARKENRKSQDGRFEEIERTLASMEEKSNQLDALQSNIGDLAEATRH
ncbi:hypothetical protein EVA_15071 [gut metagenome]|uniref:Uncharacterized protein n=1 Tax=gut metagenome TaxID=749906 RepID=J9FPE7_9ZZZZ